MIEVQILIPLNSNDGETFTDAHHAKFEDFVLARFGGMSLLDGSILGTWIQAGKTYRDTNRVYLVAMVSLLDGATLKEVLDFAKEHYKQKEVYFRYLGLSETH